MYTAQIENEEWVYTICGCAFNCERDLTFRIKARIYWRALLVSARVHAFSVRVIELRCVYVCVWSDAFVFSLDTCVFGLLFACFGAYIYTFWFSGRAFSDSLMRISREIYRWQVSYICYMLNQSTRHQPFRINWDGATSMLNAALLWCVYSMRYNVSIVKCECVVWKYSVRTFGRT